MSMSLKLEFLAIFVLLFPPFHFLLFAIVEIYASLLINLFSNLCSFNHNSSVVSITSCVTSLEGYICELCFVMELAGAARKGKYLDNFFSQKFAGYCFVLIWLIMDGGSDRAERFSEVVNKYFLVIVH